ncbi:serine/threonine protein kinase, bacterial [Anaerolineae bacterium]|nr:serine/threonine protein kinase, bacterial [Anaerolineae bacterium]
MFLFEGAILGAGKNAYTILRQIARGGMSAIYQAEDTTNHRVVAIKEACLDAACSNNIAAIRERLMHEMDVLAPLDHPNIPKVYEHFAYDNNAYLVMEFIAGETIRQIEEHARAAECRLEEARVLGWAIQILDTLTYLHARPKPIIHRDIKPENLILAPDGRVVMVDFGLMKQVESQLDSGPLIHAIGTVEFAPPEQYAESGNATDQRTDIYALGATMYYLLAGRLPPRAVERMLPISINVSLKLPSLCKINPTVSPQMERVIFQAMEIDPENRYASARAMRDALCPRKRFIPLPF